MTAAQPRYEMLWDCPSCGTEKLLGLTHRHCPNCGAAQDPTRRYFPKAGDEVAVNDHAYSGADRTCPACDTPNAALANNCLNCGSPLDGAKAVRQRADQVAGTGGAFADDSAKAATTEHRERQQAERAARQAGQPAAAPAAPQPAPGSSAAGKPGAGGPRPRKARWPIAVGVGAVALLAAALVALFWTKDVTATATGHAWQRTIDVERLTPTAESAWRDQVPSGAYAISCRREVRDHRQVPDGQECSTVRKDLGDGTFTTEQQCRTKYRSEPIYDDKCGYTIDRWKVIRTDKAAGSSVADEPRWPAVTLARPGTCVGCERQGGRSEDYTVAFAYEDKTDTCSFPQARWKTIAVGAKLPAKARVLTGGLDCASIK